MRRAVAFSVNLHNLLLQTVSKLVHIDEGLVLAVAALTKARRGFLITDKSEQRAKRRALIASIKLDIGDGKGKRRLLLVRKRRERKKKNKEKGDECGDLCVATRRGKQFLLCGSPSS